MGFDATPECPETCDSAGGVGDAQSWACIAGTIGALSADDLGSFPSKKDKFCSGPGVPATCPVSCGVCPVESCDEPLQTIPSCVAGVAPTGGNDAQAARDAFCDVAGDFLNVCQVSCGMCVVESCDDLSTTNPECRLGVTPDQDFAAQEKKDKYCTFPTQTKCPVSCMGVTTGGPDVCQP